MTVAAENPFGQAISRAVQNRGFSVREILTQKPASGRSGSGTRQGRVRGRRRVRVEREAADLGAMVARMLRALSSRARQGDLEALVQLVQLDAAVAVEQLRAARGLVDEQGYSWAQIALRLGITKQSVHEKWGPR